MKKKNLSSLRLNKKSISGFNMVKIDGGVSGGHTRCLPTTLRTNFHNCVYTADCSQHYRCDNM